jgi:hypothetical protein
MAHLALGSRVARTQGERPRRQIHAKCLSSRRHLISRTAAMSLTRSYYEAIWDLRGFGDSKSPPLYLGKIEKIILKLIYGNALCIKHL